MDLTSGVYFFHRSFLVEVSETWLGKQEISNSGELFMKIVFSSIESNQLISCDRTLRELITCDRTIDELSKPKYTLKAVPGVFDLIEERSLPDGNEKIDDDEYSFRVASLNRIGTNRIIFITSDEEKEKISKLAKSKGYSLDIRSTQDFIEK